MFQATTGFALRLVPADPEGWEMEDRHLSPHPFCPTLLPCGSPCRIFADHGHQLRSAAQAAGPANCACFRSLSVTTVPVKLGASVIAYLRTCPTLHQIPAEPEFAQMLVQGGRKALDHKTQAALKAAYLGTRIAMPRRYEKVLELLNVLAGLLAGHLNQLADQETAASPASIVKAQKFIHEYLDQPLSLPRIARHAGLSEAHFCRLFKDCAGLTLTDYVNRCRVHWAKRELLRPTSRVSEIAFCVGYQSLSQFNRSFVRIVGASPTAYRRERIEATAS